MKIKFKGQTIEVKVVEEDIRSQLTGYLKIKKIEISNTLVKYDPSTETVTVDKTAPAFYKKYAALHEAICCGAYKHLGPDTTGLDRCGRIDLEIVSGLKNWEKATYLYNRVEMFEFLIKHNLNPALNKMFETSLAIIKEELEKLQE